MTPRSLRTVQAVALLTAALLGLAAPATAQRPGEQDGAEAALLREHEPLHRLLVRLERANGVLFGRLAAEGDAVRSTPGADPTPGFEQSASATLEEIVRDPGTVDDLAAEAEAGYEALGPRAAEVIARGNAFMREVVGILVDAEAGDSRAALAEAVRRYRSRPASALASLPKDMDILYDHPHALAFRERYPRLAGFLWAGHWLQLAATEPVTDLPDPRERAAGIDTVVARYYAKLSEGEPPQSFPSQIPLAPAIAPGLIFANPETAMVWDNLTMMQEVLADVLASPTVTDVRSALDAVVDEFTDPDRRTNQRGEWESMALQHGIFFQGGYPLAVMTRSELNGDPHAAHRGAAGGLTPMPVPN